MKQTSRTTSRERTDMFYKSKLNDSSNNSLVAIVISLFAIALVLFLLFGKNFIK